MTVRSPHAYASVRVVMLPPSLGSDSCPGTRGALAVGGISFGLEPLGLRLCAVTAGPEVVLDLVLVVARRAVRVVQHVGGDAASAQAKGQGTGQCQHPDQGDVHRRDDQSRRVRIRTHTLDVLASLTVMESAVETELLEHLHGDGLDHAGDHVAHDKDDEETDEVRNEPDERIEPALKTVGNVNCGGRHAYSFS